MTHIPIETIYISVPFTFTKKKKYVYNEKKILCNTHIRACVRARQSNRLERPSTDHISYVYVHICVWTLLQGNGIVRTHHIR